MLICSQVAALVSNYDSLKVNRERRQKDVKVPLNSISPEVTVASSCGRLCFGLGVIFPYLEIYVVFTLSCCILLPMTVNFLISSLIFEMLLQLPRLKINRPTMFGLV